MRAKPLLYTLIIILCIPSCRKPVTETHPEFIGRWLNPYNKMEMVVEENGKAELFDNEHLEPDLNWDMKGKLILKKYNTGAEALQLVPSGKYKITRAANRFRPHIYRYPYELDSLKTINSWYHGGCPQTCVASVAMSLSNGVWYRID